MLEKFPKAVVDVHALVLESGGSDLAVAACAASLALADAGIEMLDLVSACSVVRTPYSYGWCCSFTKLPQLLCTRKPVPQGKTLPVPLLHCCAKPASAPC